MLLPGIYSSLCFWHVNLYKNNFFHFISLHKRQERIPLFSCLRLSVKWSFLAAEGYLYLHANVEWMTNRKAKLRGFRLFRDGLVSCDLSGDNLTWVVNPGSTSTPNDEPKASSHDRADIAWWAYLVKLDSPRMLKICHLQSFAIINRTLFNKLWIYSTSLQTI